MSLALSKADHFVEDFALQALWYVRQANEDLARRFTTAVDSRLRLLCEQPGLGKVRRFQNPKLQGLRSFPLDRPFQRILLFYRVSGDTLFVVRLMDGSRDLPRRLTEPPKV